MTARAHTAEQYGRRTRSARAGSNSRWYFVALVTAAIAISYFDRQTLPVAIAAIQHNIPISDQQFSYLQTAFLLSYAALYVDRRPPARPPRHAPRLPAHHALVVARLRPARPRDRLRTAARRALPARHGRRRRAFPPLCASSRSGSRPNERSTAMGIINAGTAVGSVLAPPLIGFVLLHSGWRTVFFAAGGVGPRVGAVVEPHLSLQHPQRCPSNTLDARAARRASSRFARAHRACRSVQAPRLRQVHERLRLVLPPLLAAQVPLRRPRLRHQTRQLLCLDPLCRLRRRQLPRRLVLQPPAAPRPLARPRAQDRPRRQRRVHAGRHAGAARARRARASLLFSIAFFCQQSWSGLIMTLPADIFPLSAVGTVSGLVGFGGAIGGAIFGVVAGLPARPRLRLRHAVRPRRNLSPDRLSAPSCCSPAGSNRFARTDLMEIESSA